MNDVETYRSKGFVSPDDPTDQEPVIKKVRWYSTMDWSEFFTCLFVFLVGISILAIPVTIFIGNVTTEDKVISCYISDSHPNRDTPEVIEYDVYGIKPWRGNQHVGGAFKTHAEAKEFVDSIGCPLYKK